MDKSTIQTLIDKVIGKKGLIRVPSWWMRKVLMQIADWVQEGNDANGEKIREVKEKISTLDTNIDTLENNTNSKITTLETNVNTLKSDTNNILFELIRTTNLSVPIKCFAVRDEPEKYGEEGYVIVDGVKLSIPENTKSIISFVNEFRFGSKSEGFNYIDEIEFNLTDTSAMTDMSFMFGRCGKLISLNLSGFDTSKVTDMNSMFDNCQDLTSLDISGFDTRLVTNMGDMFSGCYVLTSLDLSSFNTSAVTDMCGMFNYCSKLTSLDLSSFNTSKVTDMSFMFSHCHKLTSLDISGFDTRLVTNMGGMFNDCPNLTSLDLSSFDTSKVTNMCSMFYGCDKLTSLDLSSFNTSTVTDMRDMFSGCDKLTSLNLSSFDTSKVTTMSNMFDYCAELTSLILGPNFFKFADFLHLNLSHCNKWTNETVVTSLVTNSYDRKAAGIRYSITLALSTDTKNVLTDEQKAAITAKGYTIA